MEIDQIVSQLRSQRDAIDRAITALSSGTAHRGRPFGSKNKTRRTMSAAARKRISIAQKARWAAQRKAKG